MASNLTYLDPTLQPLADKVQLYLQKEKEFQRADVAATALTHHAEPAAQVDDASVSHHPSQDEIRVRLQNLRQELDSLRQEVISLLPVRDEWVKINLGYGPSRVGAFTSASPDNQTTHTSALELRVVV
ncbi:hypothetical protein K3G63_06565 [Hymenobacter sp. HSC-4F20]|uniref:hypothetical protein n=1 Tax=Hymenobacter sp. HSC-4F20 TaxID=2864135 RepID=UPI001C7330D3|nr:hypothetical protein [Hymenobacter sp. HSC-4F20]MBX0290093.1 hypothetical protein [Hymenobacter sp. HSC-4F20]